MIDRPEPAKLSPGELPVPQDYRTGGEGLTEHIAGEHNVLGPRFQSDSPGDQSSDAKDYGLALYSSIVVGGPMGERRYDNHFGRVVCLDCPDTDGRGWDPPYRPFGLPIHAREHVAKFPGHHITFWCLLHRKYESAAGFGIPLWEHGGRRSGAGAPRGNLNALRTGTRTKDPAIREAFHKLDEDQRKTVAEMLRRRGRNGAQDV